MADNKVNWGLCSMYYSIITESGSNITYGAPVPFPGAVNLTSAPRGEENEFEADNIVYYRMSANDGYDVTLETANVPDAFYKDVLGETTDASNVQFENADAVVKKIALLGQFEGDKYKKRFAFFYCTPKRTNMDSATSRKREPKTVTLSMTADPRPNDGYVKGRTLSTTDQTTYDNWFSAVHSVPGAVINSIGDPSGEFSKGSPADITATITGGGTVTGITNAGVPLGITEWDQTSATLTISENYLAELDIGTHVLAVSFAAGNGVSVSIVVGA